MTDAELKIASMNLLRRDRKGRGGGVAIYHKEDLICQELNDEALALQDTIWCSIRTSLGDECILGVIYRSPQANEEYNSRLLEKMRLVVSRFRSEILIMGDFNLPNLLRRPTHPESSFDCAFQRMLEDTPLYNHITNNTRYCGTDTPSILDLTLTTEEHVVENISYESPLGLSDHVVITFDYLCHAVRANDHRKLIRKVNINKLSACLRENVNWDSDSNNVEGLWSSLMQKLQYSIAQHSHSVLKNHNLSLKFRLRSRTRKWLKLRNTAWRDHKLCSNPETWEKFRSLRNKATKLITEDKLLHQNALASKIEANPKFLYRLVNNSSKVKPGITALCTTNGLTKTADEAAEALADFYSTVFGPTDTTTRTINHAQTVTGEMSDMAVSPACVLRTLLNLNTRKSPGADQVTPHILKECAETLRDPLQHLFSRSLSSGVIPSDWKRGVITPIFKGGNRSEVSNYRPVTLLPTISKVLERIIAEQLVRFLEENNLLVAQQHGFRKRRSCISNLLLTLDDWTQAVDAGYTVHACYLDMSKAFDRVNHSLLIGKLRQYGITGISLAWFENYLTDRTMQVRVDGALSRPIPVTSGVPQGSVLGPILFLVYVNDLPPLVHCKIMLFADDIKLWTCIRSIEDCVLLQNDLDVLYAWSQRNRLPFNFKKCKLLNVGRYVDFTYKVGPHLLERSTAEKDLGVWISSALKPSLQAQTIYRKTSRILALLKRIFRRFSVTTFQSILNAYLRPRMEYAVQAWSPWLCKDIELLQRIYHRATKLVTGLQNRPYDTRIKYLNLFDFPRRRLRGDLILMYHIMHTSNHPLQQLFIRRDARTSKTHDYSVMIPHSRVNCRRYFFSVRVCFTWNSLPPVVVNSHNLSKFKAELDLFLSENPKLDSIYCT